MRIGRMTSRRATGLDHTGHKVVATIYDAFMWNAERGLLADLRAWIAGGAAGDVLELGAGTGANFRYYRCPKLVVAAEPDPYMLSRARTKSRCAGDIPLHLARESAERMSFPDQSFDSVVCTHVLCSVVDAETVLTEVRRVLRPAGTFRFIEHVATGGVRGWLQRVFTPIWSRVSGGCHMDRQTDSQIAAAGFDIIEVRRFESWLRLLPCVAGVAMKSPVPQVGPSACC